MDFNITTVLVGLGILLLCLSPIIWMNWTSRQANKKMHLQFNDIATKSGLNISLSDTWNKMYSIGLDAASHKLLYTKQHSANSESIEIDLKNMKSCTIAKEMDGSNLEKIHLAIQFNNEPQQKLEFYNSDILPAISEEYILAEKWMNAISAR